MDLLDIAPTIADVFGVLGQGGSDKQFQGRSLLPVVGGAPGKAAVLARTVWDRPRYALRDERFKFLYDTRTGEEQLFDVGPTPASRATWRARARSAPPISARPCTSGSWAWAVRRAGARAGGQLTPEQRENLCALGYITPECQP